jgi:hypothetical protein
MVTRCRWFRSSDLVRLACSLASALSLQYKVFRSKEFVFDNVVVLGLSFSGLNPTKSFELFDDIESPPQNVFSWFVDVVVTTKLAKTWANFALKLVFFVSLSTTSLLSGHAAEVGGVILCRQVSDFERKLDRLGNALPNDLLIDLHNLLLLPPVLLAALMLLLLLLLLLLTVVVVVLLVCCCW